MIQKLLYHECLCSEPHQIPRKHFWLPPSSLCAQPAPAALQGSPVLPAQAMATQSHPAVSIPTFSLVLWAQGMKGRERWVGEHGGWCLRDWPSDLQNRACYKTSIGPSWATLLKMGHTSSWAHFSHRGSLLKRAWFYFSAAHSFLMQIYHLF